MSDLVKTLRSPATVFYEYAADDGALFKQAADRIEELEDMIRKAGGAYALHKKER